MLSYNTIECIFNLKFLFLRVSEIAVFRKLGSERVIRAISELVLTRENLLQP